MDTVHLFWVTSRAAGVVVLLASSAAVALGLLMGGRMTQGRATQLKTTHEALSLATLAALVVHAGALLGDSYLSPSLADITIPFVSGYETLWTSTGIVAGWLFVCSASPTTPAGASAPRAGAGCIAGPRSPG